MANAQAGTIRAKAALRKQFADAVDEKGYFRTVQENLIPGVEMDQFESDLRAGDGNELQTKFRAVHSSSALAVNCFGPLKNQLGDLSLLGKIGATALRFERQLPIISGRRPANLDVWIERGSDVVAVESKLLEYFTPKPAKFAAAYEAMKPPASEASWWSAYEHYRTDHRGHLDVAQLIKHYFGMRRYLENTTSAADVTLLYLFWEPDNWDQVPECIAHRAEINAFAKRIADSSVAFRWMSYSDLWKDWAGIPALATHAGRLNLRYGVRI